MINISKHVYRPKAEYTVKEDRIYCTIHTPSGEICGGAYCAKDDKDFYSERFGKRLALARARLHAIEYLIDKTQYDYAACKQFYHDCAARVSEVPAVFEVALLDKENDLRRLRAARRSLQKTINTILVSHQKALQSIKDYRSGKTEERYAQQRKVLEELDAARKSMDETN